MSYDPIAAIALREVESLKAEVEALKHDIERHQSIATQAIADAEASQRMLAAAGAKLAEVERERDEALCFRSCEESLMAICKQRDELLALVRDCATFMDCVLDQVKAWEDEGIALRDIPDVLVFAEDLRARAEPYREGR